MRCRHMVPTLLYSAETQKSPPKNARITSGGVKLEKEMAAMELGGCSMAAGLASWVLAEI